MLTGLLADNLGEGKYCPDSDLSVKSLNVSLQSISFWVDVSILAQASLLFHQVVRLRNLSRLVHLESFSALTVSHVGKHGEGKIYSDVLFIYVYTPYILLSIANGKTHFYIVVTIHALGFLLFHQPVRLRSRYRRVHLASFSASMVSHVGKLGEGKLIWTDFIRSSNRNNPFYLS